MSNLISSESLIANSNQKILEQITRRQSKKHKDLADLASIKSVVDQAARTVLREEFSSYLEGKKQLSPGQVKAIKREFVHQKAMIIAAYNLGLLHTLVAIQHSPRERISLEQLNALVTQATLNVLGDMALSYKLGKKRLSEKQIKKIGIEFENLKAKVNQTAKAAADYQALTAHQYMAMISRIRERQMAPAEDEKLFKETLLADYYQVMGCIVSYGEWKEGETVLGPGHGLPDYKVHKVIKNEQGLQIVVLEPLTKAGIPASPIFCCRGTTANLHNFLDDLNHHIGDYSFQASREEIGKTLQKLAENYGPAIITGHSLGGAIAQLITATFGDRKTTTGKPQIEAVHHFCAPGVGQQAANRFRKIPKESRPKVYQYYHARDIVPLAGGPHLPTDKITLIGSVKITDFLSTQLIQWAHSWTQLISESRKVKFKATSLKQPKREFAQLWLEGIRRKISSIAQKIIRKKIESEKKLKETITTLQSFLESKENIRSDVVRQSLEEERKLKEAEKREQKRRLRTAPTHLMH
jgi:pimeloyl-ACP methyl ester carboxylesterase